MNKPAHTFVIVIALLTAMSCNDNKTQGSSVTSSKGETIETPPPQPDYYLTSKETQRYAIFQFDSARDSSLFEHDVKAANLTMAEINAIEKLIASEINKYNKTAYRAVKFPEKYFKQLVPVINPNGEKEIWVHCICAVSPDWKKYRESATDGGNCFLYFKINLTKGKVLQFSTGGLA